MDMGDISLLTVNIAKSDGSGGLAPGDLVRFRIDIDVRDEFAGQVFTRADFRTVLFDMNGCNVYDGNTGCGVMNSTDNSQVAVGFEDGTRSILLTLDDMAVEAPQGLFYNSNFRPRGIMEPVDIFEWCPPGFVIPEPSSAMLSFFALFGGAWLGSRPRRLTRSA
jgi:hypothetical protein